MMGALLALAACGDDGSDEATQDECPPELSYAASGAPFLATYCASCHAAEHAKQLGDGDVIDSEAAVRVHGKGLYDLVLSGEMPKSGGPVPDAPKRDFLDWMECSGAAASGHDHSHDE